MKSWILGIMAVQREELVGCKTLTLGDVRSQYVRVAQLQGCEHSKGFLFM